MNKQLEPSMMNVRLMTVAAGLALAFCGAGALAQGGDDKKPTQPPSVVPVKKDEKKAEPAPTTPAKEQLVYVQLQTSMGDILLELNQSKAPLSVENFLRYVEKGHYNGTIFHRVMAGFMIQGGGFTSDLSEKATDAGVKNEWQNGLKNEKYTVAMARRGGRADSATSQFFINVADNGFLDQPRDGSGYAVFGKAVMGKDVVDKIAAVKTGAKATPSGQQMVDVPLTEVTIKTAKKLTEDEATRLKNGGAAAKPEAKPEPKPEPKKPEEKK